MHSVADALLTLSTVEEMSLIVVDLMPKVISRLAMVQVVLDMLWVIAR